MNDYSDLSRLLELIRDNGDLPRPVLFLTERPDRFVVQNSPAYILQGINYALEGNDTLLGSSTSDQIGGGPGDDFIRGRDGDDIIVGGAGNDSLFGDGGRNTVEGGAGDDRVVGGDSNDRLVGDEGDDLLLGRGGNDRILGGEGADTVVGGTGNDRINGDLGNDRIAANFGSDVVSGGGGSDTIFGGTDNDVLNGSNGNDRVYGGEGKDQLTGGAGNDLLEGEIGRDTFTPSTGNDTVVGGSGFDTVRLAGLVSDYTYAEQLDGSFLITAKDGSGSLLVSEVERFLDDSGNRVDPAATTTFQLLHASDFEGNTNAVVDAPRFATIVDALDDTYATTLFLSSGDNFIPSPFSNAAGSTNPAVQAALSAVLNTVLSQITGETYASLEAAPGRIDMAILNAMGVAASVIGNHDFDFNQAGLLRVTAAETNGTATTADDTWLGALFPYLSANMQFGPESVLNAIRDPDGVALGEDGNGKIAPFIVLEENGEQFGYIGVTTQILENISSTFGDPANPNDDVTVPPDADDVAALAAVIQPIVDALEAQGINKIILGSHLQQIRFEQALAPLLSGVDIMIGGGSDTIFADSQDRLRSGQTAEQDYPQVLTNADGEDVVLVNTDGQYQSLGRLVIDFDAGGTIDVSSIDEAISGAFAADDQGVIETTGGVYDEATAAADAAAAVAASTRGSQVKALVDAVNTAILETSGVNFFADTDVALNGARASVRTEETNLGDVSADANLFVANELADEPVLVSIKNGGGIRAEIPNDDGKISELEISTALAFNNALSLVTVTAAQLLAVLEHGVAATAPGATPGQFPQIGGVRFSYDPDLAAGSRVSDVWLTDAAGVEQKIVDDGALTAAAADFAGGIRVVTLSFLLTGGDSYPFQNFIAANPTFADVVDLRDDTNVAVGNAQFQNVGTEQDALAEYLFEFFAPDADPTNNFALADTAAEFDTRIINLNNTTFADTDGVVPTP